MPPRFQSVGWSDLTVHACMTEGPACTPLASIWENCPFFANAVSHVHVSHQELDKSAFAGIATPIHHPSNDKFKAEFRVKGNKIRCLVIEQTQEDDPNQKERHLVYVPDVILPEDVLDYEKDREIFRLKKLLSEASKKIEDLVRQGSIEINAWREKYEKELKALREHAVQTEKM